MTSNLAPWAGPLIRAHQALRDELSADVCAPPALAIDAEVSHCDGANSSTRRLELQAAALLLDWIAGRSLGVLDARSSIAEAYSWASGEREKDHNLERYLGRLRTDPAAELRTLDFGVASNDVLPYALEALETGDETLLRRGRSRAGKRASGIYYTPSDVAHFVCSKVRRFHNSEETSTHERPPRWLDPACGTGAFLRTAFELELCARDVPRGHPAFALGQSILFGVDLSPFAVQSCTYVLTIHAYLGSSNRPDSLRAHTKALSANFAVCDAADALRNARTPDSIIPALFDLPDHIVSNPPYIGRKDDHQKQGDFFSTSNNAKGRGNIYTDFARMLPAWLNSSGSGAMILPLSLSFSSAKEMAGLRSDLFGFGGHLSFAHFDRTPDSLFGDDVKTRNTILFLADTDEATAQTTPLLRWTSRSRDRLFKSIEFTSAPNHKPCIPKIGCSLERNMFDSLYSQGHRPLGDILSDAKRRPNDPSDAVLAQRPTAYNWLPFRLTTRSLENDNPTHEYLWAVNDDSIDAATVFAITQSMLAFWLWRVLGDGFHLTRRFILEIPLNPCNFSEQSKSDLQQLGVELWNEISRAPTLKRNAGRTNASYSPYLATSLLRKIDATLTSEFGLPPSVPEFLVSYMKQLVVVGRDDELNYGNKMDTRIGYGRNLSVNGN